MESKTTGIGFCIALAVVAIGFLGCAEDRSNLNQTQAHYSQAAQNSEVLNYAPDHMQQAETYLKEAEKTGDKKERDHLLYLANKHIDIAQSEANRKSGEDELQSLRDKRNRVVVDARTQEANQAKRQADAERLRALEAEARATTSENAAQQARNEVQEQRMQTEKERQEMAEREKALERQLADLQTRETERGLEVTLQGTFFEVGKADLKPGAKRHLETVARALRENPRREAVIEGHTDSVGSEDFNLGLSQKRAEAVANFLESQGVAPEKINARGYGKGFPVASNQTVAGRQQNRRVDIILLKEGEKAKESARN